MVESHWLAARPNLSRESAAGIAKYRDKLIKTGAWAKLIPLDDKWAVRAGQQEIWRIEDAVPLALGKRPSLGLLERARLLKTELPEAAEVAYLADLVTDAIGVGRLKSPLRPLEFVEWAIDKNGLDGQPLPVPHSLRKILPPAFRSRSELETELAELRANIALANKVASAKTMYNLYRMFTVMVRNKYKDELPLFQIDTAARRLEVDLKNEKLFTLTHGPLSNYLIMGTKLLTNDFRGDVKASKKILASSGSLDGAA